MSDAEPQKSQFCACRFDSGAITFGTKIDNLMPAPSQFGHQRPLTSFPR